MLARFAWCPDAPTSSRLSPVCSPFSRPCAALFHARVQPFFTPFQWTVGPSHRLATARARVVLPRKCWLTARSRGEKQMAKIVRFHHVGGPEVLHIEEVPARPPAQGEVRVQVQAMGLNRADSMFMHGVYLEPPHLPATLGYEAAGIVTAIGAQVDPSWLNKRVSTIPAFSPNQYGVLGTEVIVPVHAVAEYPAHLTPI